jgi:hypothetical protein
LNIDRESFNTAHPHSVYITKWLHSALRQLATAQKRLAGEVRAKSRAKSKERKQSQIRNVAKEVWSEESEDSASEPPEIQFSETGRKTNDSESDAYVFSRSSVIPELPGRQTAKVRAHAVILEEKLKAITQILASFGILDELSKRKQEQLLQSIYRILEQSEG